jgi:hypothetical protein
MFSPMFMAKLYLEHRRQPASDAELEGIVTDLTASSDGDRMLSIALANTQGFAMDSDWKKVMIGGKDYTTRRVFYHPSMRGIGDALRYLYVRRSIGFYFDDRVAELIAAGRFQRRGQPLEGSVVLPLAQLYWLVLSAYETLKRGHRYPLMIPYILAHSLIVTPVAVLSLMVFALLRPSTGSWAVVKTLTRVFVLDPPQEPPDLTASDPQLQWPDTEDGGSAGNFDAARRAA